MPRQHNAHHTADELLDRAEDVGSLMPKARHLLELRQAVMQLLPESLARSCAVANDRQGKLVLFAESSVIAAKLKLLAPTLRNRLYESGRQVTSVVIEVQPPPKAAPIKARKAALTPGAAAEVSKLAERVSDPRLKEILRSLARRAR